MEFVNVVDSLYCQIIFTAHQRDNDCEQRRCSEVNEYGKESVSKQNNNFQQYYYLTSDSIQENHSSEKRCKIVSIMGVFSAWGLILYVVIPTGALLLLVMTCPVNVSPDEVVRPPAGYGQANRKYARLRKSLNAGIGKIIFSNLGFMPFSLVSSLLGLLSIMAIVLSTQVITFQSDYIKNVDLGTNLHNQTRGFRRQRNLYLTLLALIEWYAVFVVYHLQRKVIVRDQLLESMKDK